jgi:hypothetical protein
MPNGWRISRGGANLKSFWEGLGRILPTASLIIETRDLRIETSKGEIQLTCYFCILLPTATGVEFVEGPRRRPKQESK